MGPSNKKIVKYWAIGMAGVWIFLMVKNPSGEPESGSFEESTANAKPVSAAEERAIKANVNGCYDGWKDKGYMSFDDCVDGKTLLDYADE